MILTYRPIGDDWPGELLTESARKPTPFKASWSSTLELLDREVDMLANGGRLHTPAVIQLAVPEDAIRQDGKLRQGRKPPEHPGVILTFEGPDGPLRFSCDRFRSTYYRETLDGWQVNARAIALGLEALRKVDRYGLGTGTEQYRGFQALGSGIPMGTAPESMTRATAAAFIAEHSIESPLSGRPCFTADEVLVDAGKRDAAFRLGARRLHPDAGGDAALFRRLTEARDLLGGGGR